MNKKAQIIDRVKGYYDPLALYPISNRLLNGW